MVRPGPEQNQRKGGCKTGLESEQDPKKGPDQTDRLTEDRPRIKSEPGPGTDRDQKQGQTIVFIQKPLDG